MPKKSSSDDTVDSLYKMKKSHKKMITFFQNQINGEHVQDENTALYNQTNDKALYKLLKSIQQDHNTLGVQKNQEYSTGNKMEDKPQSDTQEDCTCKYRCCIL